MKIRDIIKMKNTPVFVFFLLILFSCAPGDNKSGGQFYDLGTGLKSRSISFENPTGEPGKGGLTASGLGVGRKGSPAKGIAPGETVVLCDIKGTGTIRHIWMTGGFRGANSDALRSMVIRAYWENQEHPSIECPLGDFMGSAHAKINSYQSAVHSVGINSALNIWLPMPFSKNARMTLTNEGDQNITLFYQIDYTITDKHPENFGRLHVCFRRNNPTTLKEDFEILPKRTGEGRFIGTVLGIRTLEGNWWGEGEVKIYLDGDKEFPTICGTGSEDYVCLSYGMQQTPFLYHGCSWNQDGFISMFRWHLPDPIYWEKECRITIQQIGYSGELRQKNLPPLYERQDDWSCATFWYEPVPSAKLPAFPDLNSRTANLWEEPKP
jgi:hypothetical protein